MTHKNNLPVPVVKGRGLTEPHGGANVTKLQFVGAEPGSEPLQPGVMDEIDAYLKLKSSDSELAGWVKSRFRIILGLQEVGGGSFPQPQTDREFYSGLINGAIAVAANANAEIPRGDQEKANAIAQKLAESLIDVFKGKVTEKLLTSSETPRAR